MKWRQLCISYFAGSREELLPLHRALLYAHCGCGKSTHVRFRVFVVVCFVLLNYLSDWPSEPTQVFPTTSTSCPPPPPPTQLHIPISTPLPHLSFQLVDLSAGCWFSSRSDVLLSLLQRAVGCVFTDDDSSTQTTGGYKSRLRCTEWNTATCSEHVQQCSEVLKT